MRFRRFRFAFGLLQGAAELGAAATGEAPSAVPLAPAGLSQADGSADLVAALSVQYM